MSARDGLFSDEAGVRRCARCQASAAYRDYHDHEWGFPVDDDARLFEKLCLEPAAVLRWTEALGITDEALMKAVRVVGHRVDRIKDYLGAGGMAGDQADA